MEPAVHCHSKSVLYDAGSDDFQIALLFCNENITKDFTHFLVSCSWTACGGEISDVSVDDNMNVCFYKRSQEGVLISDLQFKLSEY